MRVYATAINPLDYQIRRGDDADCVPLPAIIGHDDSGVVEEKGVNVSEFEIGDEVHYTPKIFDGPGSYAERSSILPMSIWSPASRATSTIWRPPA